MTFEQHLESLRSPEPTGPVYVNENGIKVEVTGEVEGRVFCLVLRSDGMRTKGRRESFELPVAQFNETYRKEP